MSEKLSALASISAVTTADEFYVHVVLEPDASASRRLSFQDLQDSIREATSGVKGFMSASDKLKMDGLASGATANSSDGYLLDRANHTGTQAQSTISSLVTDLGNKVATSRLINTGDGLAGGGNLTGDLTLTADYASQAQAEAGTDTAFAMNPLRVAQAIAALGTAATLSDDIPEPDGTGYEGVGTESSRSDHVHPASNTADFERINRFVPNGTSAVVEFIFDETLYDGLEMYIDGVFTSSAAATVVLETTRDGGSNWDQASGDYSYAVHESSDNGTTHQVTDVNTSTTNFPLGVWDSTDVDWSVFTKIFITNPADTGAPKLITAMQTLRKATAETMRREITGSYFGTNNAIDGVRIRTLTGTFDGGTVILRGHLKSAPIGVGGTTMGNATPLIAAATPAVGTAILPSREDHVHPTEVVGRQTVSLPSSSIRPMVVSGCEAPTNEAQGSDHPDDEFMVYVDTANTHGQFIVPMPKSWDRGTLKFQVGWKHEGAQTAGLDGVVWGLAAVGVVEGENPDKAYGIAVKVTDDEAAGNVLHWTAESAAMTVAGTLTDPCLVYFRLTRFTADGGDDMDQGARLVCIKVFYNVTTGRDD